MPKEIKPVRFPYHPNHNPNATWRYHARYIWHFTKSYYVLKSKVQELLDQKAQTKFLGHQVWLVGTNSYCWFGRGKLCLQSSGLEASQPNIMYFSLFMACGVREWFLEPFMSTLSARKRFHSQNKHFAFVEHVKVSLKDLLKHNCTIIGSKLCEPQTFDPYLWVKRNPSF